MLSVSSNLVAMNAQRQFNIVSGSKAKSTEKLSSGFRINRAADDAAGLAISEKMRRQINGLTRASENVQDGISFVQTAEGALTEVHDMLQKINQLSVQASNDTLSTEDRFYINEEVQNLKTEIDRIFETTEFNEKPIWPKNAEKQTVIGYKDVPAVTTKHSSSSFDLSNENIDEMPNSYIKVSASMTDGISFSWTGFDGVKYKTDAISLDDLKAKNYSVNLKELYAGATGNGSPVSLYQADGVTPLFDVKFSFSVADVATDADIINGLNNASIYTSAGISSTAKWLTPSSLSLTGSTLYIDAAYRSYAANQTDAFNFDTGGDGTITPKEASGNMISYPTATTVEEAKNDTNKWQFKFNMSGIGEVTGTVNSAYYCGNDGDDEGENTWWRWVYPYYPETKKMYKSTLSYSIEPTLKGVMDSLTGGYKSSTPGLLNAAEGGCSKSGGYINFSMSLNDSSGKSIGSQSFRFNVSAGDTEQNVFDKIKNSLNNATVFDYDITTSNVTGGGYIATHSDKRNYIKEPIYKARNEFCVQAGADAWQTIPISYDSLTTRILGINNTTTETVLDSQNAIDEVKKAMEIVSEQRADFGAYQNRLEHTVRNLDNVVENTTAAESAIRDTDMAKEMVNFSLHNILEQAGTSMMGQANQMNERVMSLLQ